MPRTKKQSTKRQKPHHHHESDSAYFLKLVLYVILGTVWIKFHAPIQIGSILLGGIPIGLFIGLFFAAHDHFQVDRKIAYAILVVMTVISFFVPAGIVI